MSPEQEQRLVDVRPRRGGKTISMLEAVEALEDPSQAIIVCISANEAARVGVLYNERNPGKPLPRFVTPEGARRSRGMRGRQVFVDNADILLEELIGHPINFLTVSGRTND